MNKSYGIDVSHHQGKIDWSKVTAQFVFIKCTEAHHFIDENYQQNKVEARKRGVLVGSYHFAQGLDAKREANFFYKNVGDIQSGELLALDFEITIPNPVAWCNTFLKELERLCGFKPLIYLSDSFLKKYDWTPVSNGNYGLWAARYGLNTGYLMTSYKPSSGSWPFYAVWQYTSRGKMAGINGNVDLNEAQCDIVTLKKYGKPESQPSAPEPYAKYLPDEPGKCNCVLYVRSYVPSLPYGLFTLGNKRAIINASKPKIGSVAVMNVGTWGHVGVVTNIEDNMVTIKEANYKNCRISERRNTEKNLKIIGYYQP